MKADALTYHELAEEVTSLRLRLTEAGETLSAILRGEVDGVLAQGPQGNQLFTLKGADDPYRVLIEEMNQGAVTLSAAGSILYCNRRFADLLKTSLEEIMGHAFGAFVVPDERAAFTALLEAGRLNASAAEITLCASDASAVPLQLALGPLPAESAAAICLVATDISESKRAEAELKSSEARLSDAQESAHVGSWEWDMQTHKLTWSDELYRIYRLDQANFVPTFEGYADLVHPEERARVMANVEQALHDRGFFNHDHRIIRADGSPGVVQARGRMVLDDAGEPLKFVGTSQDITERNQVEAALETANEQLRDASRRAGMAEVATSVLHNVGNVLNSVNVSCSVIGEKIAKSRISSVAKTAELLREHAHDLASFITTDPVGQKLPEFFTRMADHLAAERASILQEVGLLSQNITHIKDIVAVQQSYAKDIGGVSETLSLSDLIEDAVRINEGELAGHRIKISRDYGEAPAVPMEKHRVLQILVNLVRNAKHALVDSGRADKQLSLRIARDNGSVAVSVSDNGVGIARENMTRIFAHGFTTRKDGHGFGLHSGVLAAQQMGGSLTVESAGLGAGAVFMLRLPAAAANSR